MSGGSRYSATVLLDEEQAAAFRSLLEAEGVAFEYGGVRRGVAEGVGLFALATPSIAVLALVFEKLRRMRQPRVYIQVKEDGKPKTWKDLQLKDGRTVVFFPDGAVEDLHDKELSAGTLARLLRGGPGEDEI